MGKTASRNIRRLLRLGGLEGDNGGRRGEAGAVVLVVVGGKEGGGGTARAGALIISGLDVLLVSPPCVCKNGDGGNRVRFECYEQGQAPPKPRASPPLLLSHRACNRRTDTQTLLLLHLADNTIETQDLVGQQGPHMPATSSGVLLLSLTYFAIKPEPWRRRSSS